jgi:hypothetical protein
VHRRSVVALDESQQVRHAALVDVDCIDVPEVVIEEVLHLVPVVTEFGGDPRRATGHLRDLFGLLLLLLELYFES